MASPVKGFIGAVLVAASFLNPITAIWGGKLAVAMFAAGANLIQTSARGPLTQQQQGIQQNVTSTEQPLPVIYGRAKIGVAITDIRVDPDSQDDRDLYLVGALCTASEDGNGIEAVEKVWLDERLAIDPPVAGDLPQETNVQDGFKARDTIFATKTSMLAYGLHLGTDAQTTDSHLASTFPTFYKTLEPAEEGKGIAYLALRLRHHEDVYSGIPNVTAQVQGQQVYDPRSATWGWSDNPALCALDYLASKRYGLGADYSERDGGTESEIEEQSFIDAANYFDELVDIPGGTTQKRATCNGIIFTGDTVGANLQALLSAGRGQIVYEGGKFRYIVHRATTAETFELTEDNIVGDIEFLVGGTKETANRMLATFVDPDLDWQPDDVSWPEADATNTFLTNDGGFENVREIDLPFTTDRYMAQQQLQVALRESRADLGIGLTAKEEALKLRVGSLVKVTHSDPGWTEKEFWVNALAVTPDGTIRLILEEYDETAYTLDALSTKDTPPDTSLPDVYSVPAPTNLVLTSDDTTALSTQDGQKQPRIKVEWTAAENPFLDHYLIRYKPDAESQWLEAPNVPAEETATLFGAVTDGVLYDVAVIAVNSMGKKSDALQGQVTVATQNPTFITLFRNILVAVGHVAPGDYWNSIAFNASGGTQSVKVLLEDGTGTDLERYTLNVTPNDTYDNFVQDAALDATDPTGSPKQDTRSNWESWTLTLTPFSGADGTGAQGVPVVVTPGGGGDDVQVEDQSGQGITGELVRTQSGAVFDARQDDDGNPAISLTGDARLYGDIGSAADAKSILEAARDDLLTRFGRAEIHLGPEVINLSTFAFKSRTVLVLHGTEIVQVGDTHTQEYTGTAESGTSTSLTDTDQAWTVDELVGYSVHITGGTGSGQVREIISNTATELTIYSDEAWTTTPDGTSTYQIVSPIHLFTADTTSEEQFGIAGHGKLFGNDANQKARNKGIYWDLSGAGPFDTGVPGAWIRTDKLIIKQAKGTGLHIKGSPGGFSIQGVVAQACKGHAIDSNSTDSRFHDCIANSSGLSGFNERGFNNRWSNCKSFGSGSRGITGNQRGVLLSGHDNVFSGCQAQENPEEGFLVSGNSNTIDARCDINGGGGVKFTGDHNLHTGTHQSQSGFAHAQPHALDFASGANGNRAYIVTEGLTSRPVLNTSDLANNYVEVNLESQAEHFNKWGVAGTDDTPHFLFGKENSPASGNPNYALKTGPEAVPVAKLTGFDGTSTFTFWKADYDAAEFILGDSAPVDVRVAAGFQVDGASTMVGAVTMQSTLDVTGASTLTGNVTIGGNLHTDDDVSQVRISGGNGVAVGAESLWYGGTHASRPGWADHRADVHRWLNRAGTTERVRLTSTALFGTGTLGESGNRWSTIYGVDLDLSGVIKTQATIQNNTSTKLIIEASATSITDDVVIGQLNIKGADDSAGLGALLVWRANGAWTGSSGVRPTDVEFWTNNGSTLDTRMILESDGQIGYRVSSDPSTRADFAHIYAKDVSTSAELFVRDEAGNVTQISPHDPEGWWYHHAYSAHRDRWITIHVERLLRDLIERSGLKAADYIMEEAA